MRGNKWTHMLKDSSMRVLLPAELRRAILLQCRKEAREVRDIKGSVCAGVLQSR